MIFIISCRSVNIVLMAALIQLLFIQAEPHHGQAPFPRVHPAPHTSTPHEVAQSVPSVSQCRMYYKKSLQHQTLEQQLSLRPKAGLAPALGPTPDVASRG